jgi:hypothetical protein
VNGQRYSWHQPEDLVHFDVEITESPSENWEAGVVKPVEMPRRKFGEGKALIRWVLDLYSEKRR